MRCAQDVVFFNVKFTMANDVTMRLQRVKFIVHLCVCVCFCVRGSVFCIPGLSPVRYLFIYILVVYDNLNDSLFDFFPVTQLTVINLVSFKPYNGPCVSYCTYIPSTVS